MDVVTAVTVIAAVVVVVVIIGTVDFVFSLLLGIFPFLLSDTSDSFFSQAEYLMRGNKKGKGTMKEPWKK